MVPKTILKIYQFIHFFALENINFGLQAFAKREVICSNSKPAFWFLIEIKTTSDLDCPSIIDPNFAIMKGFV